MMESSLIKAEESRLFSLESSALADPQHSCMEEPEHLQVYLRIRPFTSAESNGGESQDCITIESPNTVLLKHPSLSLTARLSAEKSLPQTGQRFQFSKVYGPETTQGELFEGTVKELVKDVLEGGNSLVFTYGVTNAGKTFTFLGPDADAGILPRSLAVIFSSIDEHLFPGVSFRPHRCREFTRLSAEQQVEEALFKRNLLRQFKETDKTNASVLNSTSKTFLEGSPVFGMTDAAEDKINLSLEANTKFSVWVSFCEIYNENIHDLLEVAPWGALRRTALRLSQDVKGNAFVKDLRWVQVSSAEEAYKVVKLGKKNQSFSSTRLNHVSSRSHSIFSVRILRIDDTGTQRVQTVSELCLCDLAGSERCAKTQNIGERLKEAGNINTSLLILGKCINALRHNQQAKLLQHIPFRESKLTHYLQSFFSGRGRACIIVNINQCASMYDETLNVLKFSAVAQKVVVLPARPLLPPPVPLQTSRCDVSITHGAEGRAARSSRRSSLIGWESSLEDVQEDDDDEEELSLMDDTMDQTGSNEECDENDKVVICKKTHQRQLARLKQLQLQLKKERAEGLLLESRVREETSHEFSQLFTRMQSDFDERIAREKELLEERSERRLEIFKNLINKMSAAGASPDVAAMDKLLDSQGLEPADQTRPSSDLPAGSQTNGSDAVGTMETMELINQQQKDPQLLGNNHNAVDGEGQRRLLSELQEKSSEVSRLQEQLQKMVALNSQRHLELAEERSSQEDSLAELEKERRQREAALAALEYQTLGKEEALASLEKERKARGETAAALEELKQHKQETMASLQDERRDKEKAAAALEAESRGREDAVAALAQEKQSREEVQAALELQRTELSRLVRDREDREKEFTLLTDKLEAAELQVSSTAGDAAQVLVQLQAAQTRLEQQSKEIQDKSSETRTLTQEVQMLKQELQTSALSAGQVGDQLKEEVSELRRNLDEEKEKNQSIQTQKQELERELKQVSSTAGDAAQVLVQLQAAQTRLEEQSKEIQDKSSEARTLTQEVQTLRQELQTSALSAGRVGDQLKEEVSELRRNLDEEKEKNESIQNQKQELERELKQVREQLEHKQLLSEQQFSEKQDETEAAAERQAEELKEKLKEQEETSHQLQEELRSQLRCQQEASREEVERLNAKVTEQTQQMERLNEKLQEQETLSTQRLDELQQKLSKQEENSQTLLNELREKLSEQEKEAEQLRAELGEARLNASPGSSISEAETLRTENSDPQAQVLEAKPPSTESTTESFSTPAAQPASGEKEQIIKEKDAEMEQKLAELKESSAQTEAELEKKLLDLETQVRRLQKSLREAEERREEEESAAVQEARRREVERRRELLAVAHEAIATKDAELEKKGQEISRLKENADQDSDKLKGLSLDLQRTQDDSSDLKEKLADYKKQMQQVQKEISSMREEEKVLRQKLSDVEKSKKQLQSDLSSRDRAIQQLKLDQSNPKSDDTPELSQKARTDLEARERVIEDMRLALTEQEDTQEQMETVLEEKLTLIQELSGEVDKLKGLMLLQHRGNDSPSDDVRAAKEEAAQARESLKTFTDKHQAERRKWLEEKMSLIGQAKEAEDKRNQEMRKFAEDRERSGHEKSQLRSQLVEKEEAMEKWRKERDTLVAALEVQLQKLLCSQAEKDQLIKQLQLQQQNTQPPPPEDDADAPSVADLQAALAEKETEIQRLKDELQDSTDKHEHSDTPSENGESPATKPENESTNTKSERKQSRVSVGSQSSAGYPSVLESSEISTENGRTSRFPRPELEISFSPLQPNRMALRRQGDKSAVTVKITHSARKRKSGEMEKEEVEAENRRNTRTRLTSKLTPHKEESSSPAGCRDSQNSPRGRKEGTLQKIGDFLQSSPTLLGSKAKKMMSLVGSRTDADASTSSSLRLRSKKSKKKLYRPEISCPMDMPPHPIITREPEEEKESHHQIIKRRLRSRVGK
ncbi:kinesin-like protein KIF20B isoform X2 [Cololabis saira]|uniref:kinesin-like protein KIF20B isoform X2 n=1 Tax=Cololabis saira TaxID=129043 RepID=UPI002AD31558|nr:kinesin-like protein KIF20B isoform X2 [Cololabis saira]